MSSKTLFTSIALAVLLLFGAFTPSFGQNPDLCKPDCEGSNFGPTQVDTLVLPGGCVVRVKYAVRIACGFWNDLGIISIEPLTPGCGFFTVGQLLNFTTQEMLRQNPMGFPTPDTGTCTTQWRVVNGACWKDSVTHDGDSVYAACDTVACCLSGYRICTDSAGQRTVTKLGSGSAKDCDTTDLHCTPVCGDEEESLNSPQEPGLGSVEIDNLPHHDVVLLRRDPDGLPTHADGGTKGIISAASEQKKLMRARE